MGVFFMSIEFLDNENILMGETKQWTFKADFLKWKMPTTTYFCCKNNKSEIVTIAYYQEYKFNEYNVIMDKNYIKASFMCL